MKINHDHISLVSIIIGIVLAITFMSKGNFGSGNFEDAALGEATVPHYAEDEHGNKVHYIPSKDYTKFITGINPYKENETVLYLGNSQSHSINQIKQGDNTMSGYLFNEMLDSNITFLTASIPNANFQEHYLLYNRLNSSLPKLKLLVVSVFMDDLRETGIREAYFKKFGHQQFRINDNSALAIEINQILESFEQNSEVDTTETDGEEFNALNETTQNITEKAINKHLKENFSFWKNRENIRGQYFTTLYKSRNTLLNISSQSTRKMIKGRYEKNLNALQLIIDLAKKNNTKVLLVIPPLRQDIKYPYDKNEYIAFKNRLNEIAQKSSLKLIDLDHIVEPKYWGYSAPTQLFKDKDYDFMHFQAEAHKILADSIKPYILREML